MTTVLTPTSNPSNGQLFSSVMAYAMDGVVLASCTGPTGVPPTGARVSLLLSPDGGVTFCVASAQNFGQAPNAAALIPFALEDYASTPITANGYYVGTAGSPFGAPTRLFQPPWTHYMLLFGGNSLSAVTCSATVDAGQGVPATGATITQALLTIPTPAFASTINLDLATASIFAPTALTGNVNLTLTHAPATAPWVRPFTVILTQDGTGSRLVSSWFSGFTITWSGGVAPTLSTAAGGVDTFTFIQTGATSLLGYITGQTATPGGGGTVTTASVATANGFAGTVATATTTPVFTLTTTATGILVGNGTAIAAAADVGIGANGQLNQTAIATPGTLVAGDRWLDSTQLCFAAFDGGATAACLTGYVNRVIFVMVTNTTIATTSGATSVITTTSAIGTRSLPAGFLNVVGRSLRIRGGGYLTTGATQGVLYFVVKLGSVVVATGSSQATTAASLTTEPISIDITLTVKAAGASGKLDSTGAWLTPNGVNNAVACYFGNGTTTGLITTTQTTIDLTAAYTLDLQAVFTNANDTLLWTNLTIEVIG